MDATYQILAAAAELGEFTVAVLAAQAGANQATVRTVLNRHRHLFEQYSADSGRRGGQPRVWRVKDSARREIETIIADIADRFGEDRHRLLPSDPEYATAEDLVAYAPHLGARELLPHMVRRLLVATPGVVEVSAAAGDGIGSRGFDGRVNASVASPFVPEGFSVWEMGTGSDPRGKAQDDFERRTRKPGDVDPTSTTYVAVAMRRFAGRNKWAAQARSAGPWRDVRLLDADDLHAWLEQVPEVHVWVSEQLGLHPLGVTSLTRWSESWLQQTAPPTPLDLVLAGRRDVARELRRKLHADGVVVGVAADSREEALAFTAATVLADDPEAQFSAIRDPLSNAVVVNSERAWRRLVGGGRRAVLVPWFDGADVAAAIRNGHRIVVPMGASDDRSRAGIKLGPIARDEAFEVLRRADPRHDLDAADHRAAHVRRGLLSYRRAHAVNPAYKRPAWAQRPAADALAPLVLVGSWEAESKQDQEVLARISGRAYAEIERELRNPPDPEDRPFIHAGELWQLTSPVDAWTLLRSSLGSPDLQRWREAALLVLSEDNPADELQPQDRPFAPVRGIQRKYSPALRKGLARGAALLASPTDPGDRAPDGRSWSDHAEDVVAGLLGQAPGPRRWSGLEDVLPVLAEAAPVDFLRAAAGGLKGTDPVLKALFTDDHNIPWATRSPRTGLLWALEVLAWPDEYTAEACELLAKLAEIDPSGRLTSTPAESLHRILLPWYPQTAAPLHRRMDIVEGILERHPAAGWPLLLGLLPHRFDNSHPTCRPLFRDWKSQATEAAPSERADATHRLVGIALTHLGRAPEAWADFIKVLPDLPPDDRARALEDLGAIGYDLIPADVRLAIWRELAKFIATHRRSPTAPWALPDHLLRQFETIADAWEPLDSPERHARFFDWRPDLPGVSIADQDEHERELSERRRSVVSSVLQASGDDGLSRLIAEAPEPAFVGETVAEVERDRATHQMLARLGGSETEQRAASAWVARMAQLAGQGWVTSMLQHAGKLPERNRARLYLVLPNEPATWNAVDADTASVTEQYWQSIGPLTAKPDHALAFADKLLDHHRPWSAIADLALRNHQPDFSIPPALMERALRDAAEPGNPEPLPPGPVSYEVGILLDRFESAGGSPDTLIELEWIYFQALQHTRAPKALFAALAGDPKLFVSLVRLAFRGKSEPAAISLPSNEAARALQAFMALREWRQPPGLNDQGTFDGKALHEWVTTARRLLREPDRTSVGDECIGEVLSGSPVGADGIWPAEPVRALIEDLESDSLDRGLAIGKQNARGITMRGMFDGGRQEDSLAAQYETWSKQVMARWPRTGRLLREMARSYRAWARREDAESEEWAVKE